MKSVLNFYRIPDGFKQLILVDVLALPDTVKMTPEILCTIVFGIVASVLTLITVLQAHRKRHVSGTLSISCMLLIHTAQE
jgi:hypothetical protein